MSYKKIYESGCKDYEKFMKFSKWAVKNYVSSDSRNSHLTEEALHTIAEVSAIDMAIGSKLTKNKYIITGIIIGGVVVAGAMTSKRFKMRGENMNA